MDRTHSITFYFDHSHDETARALLAMAEFLQEENGISVSAVQMLGYIADNLYDWAPQIRDDLRTFADGGADEGYEKAHQLAVKFREIGNLLDGLMPDGSEKQDTGESI